MFLLVLPAVHLSFAISGDTNLEDAEKRNDLTGVGVPRLFARAEIQEACLDLEALFGDAVSEPPDDVPTEVDVLPVPGGDRPDGDADEPVAAVLIYLNYWEDPTRSDLVERREQGIEVG